MKKSNGSTRFLLKNTSKLLALPQPNNSYTEAVRKHIKAFINPEFNTWKSFNSKIVKENLSDKPVRIQQQQIQYPGIENLGEGVEHPRYHSQTQIRAISANNFAETFTARSLTRSISQLLLVWQDTLYLDKSGKICIEDEYVQGLRSLRDKTREEPKPLKYSFLSNLNPQS